jgi:hypothetical protein
VEPAVTLAGGADRGPSAWSTLAWIAALAACVVGLRHGTTYTPRCRWPVTKTALAQLTVQKYANEAYPQWRWVHPLESCARLVALNVYMHRIDIDDPWGHEYQVRCDRFFEVLSLGDDGTLGTADDVSSR